ncbi:hypothetical protein [Bradyrhizobium sp. AS23.2]|uniref:hypothetical protein n=1 Tax=Bradyrhizobium sp. AS23.2 TaxID=1680155 RepID=UPI001FDA8DF5|nr:hypothetical protein [Bradyrhizobium sp. AS23.2]
MNLGDQALRDMLAPIGDEHGIPQEARQALQALVAVGGIGGRAGRDGVFDGSQQITCLLVRHA